MIKDKEFLQKFEKEILKKYSCFEKNLKIFNEMLKMARYLKKIPLPDPFEDIEIDIKYARVINGIKKSP